MENTTEEIEQETPAKQEKTGFRNFLSGYNSFKKVLGIIIMVCYRLRKFVMAAPVIYYALKLARYNAANLPKEVGIYLQNSGEFAMMIDRYLAVMGPLVLTCACLFLMLFSRKAMYSWAISIFTLALPVLLLISNVYPA